MPRAYHRRTPQAPDGVPAGTAPAPFVPPAQLRTAQVAPVGTAPLPVGTAAAPAGRSRAGAPPHGGPAHGGHPDTSGPPAAPRTPHRNGREPAAIPYLDFGPDEDALTPDSERDELIAEVQDELEEGKHENTIKKLLFQFDELREGLRLGRFPKSMLMSVVLATCQLAATKHTIEPDDKLLLEHFVEIINDALIGLQGLGRQEMGEGVIKMAQREQQALEMGRE